MMTPPMEFTERCIAAASELALFFANEPEEKMLAALSQTRKNLTAELTETIGAEVAASFADRFIAAVVGRRRELLLN